MTSIKAYFIEIKEVLTKTIRITAEDKDSALLLCKQKYKSEEFVLGYADYAYTEFTSKKMSKKISKSKE